MSEQTGQGMTPKFALRLEFFIIGIGVLALFLIFQPFSMALFAVGSMLVVVAGLMNNLLPMAKPGVQFQSVIRTGMIVLMIFCIVLLISITAAHLYGVFFLRPPNPDTLAGKAMLAAKPFYLHPFVWSVAGFAAVLALLITKTGKRS